MAHARMRAADARAHHATQAADASQAMQRYNGIAPKAKVVVTDISPSFIPMSLSAVYFDR